METLRAMREIFSAWRRTDFSSSITQGPAIRTRLPGFPNVIFPSLTSLTISTDLHGARVLERFKIPVRARLGTQPQFAVLQRVADEFAEKRVRGIRFGLELGMILAGNKPGMILQLHDFHQIALRALAGYFHPGFFKDIKVIIGEFITVPVAFLDFFVFISLEREGRFL